MTGLIDGTAERRLPIKPVLPDEPQNIDCKKDIRIAASTLDEVTEVDARDCEHQVSRRRAVKAVVSVIKKGTKAVLVASGAERVACRQVGERRRQ